MSRPDIYSSTRLSIRKRPWNYDYPWVVTMRSMNPTLCVFEARCCTFEDAVRHAAVSISTGVFIGYRVL